MMLNNGNEPYAPLEELKQRRDEQLSYLYGAGGVRLFSDTLHEMKETAIEREYADGVRKLLAKAEADKAKAAELGEKADSDPTRWLTTDELQEAQTRAPFILEDMADASAEQWMTRIKQAIEAKDKAGAWLLLRLAPNVGDIQEPSLMARRDYVAARGELESFVVPSDVRTARRESHAAALEAEKRRVMLKFELHQIGGAQMAFNPW